MWQGVAVYVGYISDNQTHRHNAAQLCIAEGDLTLKTAYKERKATSALIPPKLEHCLIGGNVKQMIILIDGDLCWSEKISRDKISYDLLPKTPAFQDWTFDEIKVLVNEILSSLGLNSSKEKDQRIIEAIALIKETGGQKIKAAQLAKRVGLSESRFLHLFSENLGLTLRSYVKWQRFIFTIKQIQAGKDLTSAAQSAGFSDSAHFSRSFKENFGFKPSSVIKSNQQLDIFI